MNHGSLFSGIGGFDLAAEWAGWQNAFHCEWNEFGQKILKYYWPNAKSYGDITQTDFTIWRNRIDVLSGGFPCQPYSHAGKRLGKEDDRHLWPQMLRAIREIQPSYIVGENVFGIVNWNGGLVFNEVQTDLENEGYEVQPVILPACSVNAPHKRERIWFVAYNSNARLKGLQFRRENGIHEFGFTSNTDNNGQYGPENRQSNNKGNENNQTGANSIEQFEGCCGQTNDTYSTNVRLQRKRNSGETERERQNGIKQSFGLFNIQNWENFPTQSPVCSGNDGLSSKLDGITFPKWRNESIKAYGNAIVPQVAYQIFKAIQMADEQYKITNNG